MFLSIGWDNVVRAKDVVAILEYDQAAKTVDPVRAENDEADDAAAKSIIVTTEGIYSSPLSVQTLKRRAAVSIPRMIEEENL
ncbi:extracellular matrix regulator RemB [Terribacillus halophilus]|jgi:extracellular matrix regulatory protein B|uniref:extracellular matrix regulator RemB n=1 Tax=Terribacillus halophilus TaxID=361279 RepID=UPI0009862EFF|nr:extracellular matrix/biofilm biosynthesis regulator RemA family protein [Terribacillus halophilus]